MRNIFFTVVFISSFLRINGQTISWISSGAGDENRIYNGVVDIGYSVVSNDDEVYLTGLVTGAKTAIIQDSTINNGKFCFLAKYNQNGELKWVRELEGWGRTDVALNSKNEIFVAANTGYKSYIVKYDKLGNLLWKKEILKNSIFPRPNAIAIDSKDAIYVCGAYQNSTETFVVEDTLLQGLNSSEKAFIIKYDNYGEFQWFSSANGGEFSVFQDIKVDENDDVVTAGYFETNSGDSVVIGNFQVSSILDLALTANLPTQDALVAKYNSNGDILWVNAFGGIKNDWANKISINKLNEILVVGTFIDSAKIDNISFKSKGAYDISLSKLTAEGDAVWVKTAGGPYSGIEAGRSVTTDIEGNIFISGEVITSAKFGNGDNEVKVSSSNNVLTKLGFVAMYSEEGSFQWVKNIADGESTIEDIFYHNGAISLCGNFYPETQFLNIPIPVSYSNTFNFFIASVSMGPMSSCEIFNKDNINIYPNPTTGIIKVNSLNSLDIYDLNIININGEVVVSEKNQREPIILDLSHLPNGIYILKALTNNGLFTKKIVKAKK
jgi:hypothetical protein